MQIRLFPTALRFLFNNATLFGKRADQTGMSSFQALATAVAAQVGTGNVAGAATAIVAGGPAHYSGYGSRHFSAWLRFLPKPY